MTISCTKKVLDKIKSTKQISIELDKPHLFNWYCDSVIINRKKYALLVNSLTLFSFMIKLGTKKEVSDFEPNFLNTLSEQIIRHIGYNDKILSLLSKQDIEFKFTKTNSMSILGSINDIKQRVKYIQIDSSDITNSINALTQYLNRTPMGKLDYRLPKESFKEAVLNL